MYVYMCMYVCVFVCICLYMCVYSYVCMCICVFENKILMSLSEFIQTPSLSDSLFVRNAHIHIYTNTNIHKYIHTYVFTYIYVHICVHSYIHTYSHVHRHIVTHTDVHANIHCLFDFKWTVSVKYQSSWSHSPVEGISVPRPSML